MSETTNNTQPPRGRGGPGRHNQRTNVGLEEVIEDGVNKVGDKFSPETRRKNYAKEIKHLKIIFMDLEEPTIDAPQPPSTRQTLSTLEETILAEETKQYIKDKRNINTAMASLYSVV